jgi:hypothetical protein
MSATWTMKNGEKIKVEDMEHSHVVNCLNLMARKYPEYFSKFQTSVTKHTEVECKRALTKLLGMVKKINEERQCDWEDQMYESLAWDMYWDRKDY